MNVFLSAFSDLLSISFKFSHPSNFCAPDPFRALPIFMHPKFLEFFIEGGETQHGVLGRNEQSRIKNHEEREQTKKEWRR